MTQGRGSLGAAVLVAVALSGCTREDRGGDESGWVASPGMESDEAAGPSEPHVAAVKESAGAGRPGLGAFAVSHDLGAGVAPQWVHPHFLSLRDACLNDEALHCELLAASASIGRREAGFQRAFVEARVPHDAVAAFKTRALSPLKGEEPGEIEIRRDWTKNENVARPIADVARRQKHLEGYRERLEVLASRAESRVEDLIRIAEELSRVQGDLEALAGQGRDLDERARTERIRVVFEALRPAVPAADPVLRVLSNAGRMFWQSMADALAFLVRIVPWLPLAALLAGAVIGFVRLVRRI